VSIETLIQILLIGLTNGAIFALIALGYTLVYGIIELINFAHGDLYMLGTMMALTIVTAITAWFGARRPIALDPFQSFVALVGALLIAMVFCATVNVLIERLAYRRLRNAPRLAPLISAIGMSFILVNIGLLWKGASPVDFPGLRYLFFIDASQDVFRDWLGIQWGIRFTWKELFVLVLAVPLMIGLNLFVNRTRLGKAMRATAQDRQAAAMMGIDINLTIALAFLLGGALAGSAGLIAGLFNNTAFYLQGFRAGLMAFTAAVLGGIGNIQGAFLGGMLIGLIAAFSDFLIDPRWTQAVIFGILILVLVFKPTGLLGEETPERA
jgi:branched-chain amino acid transport system permease protein